MYRKEFSKNVLKNIDRVYVSGNTKLISQILSSIIAEKLVFEGKLYRTLVFHEALALILNTSKAWNKNKKGQTAVTSNLSSLVVPTGIEPVYQVPETCVLSIVLRDQKIFLAISKSDNDQISGGQLSEPLT